MVWEEKEKTRTRIKILGGGVLGKTFSSLRGDIRKTKQL